MDRLGVYTLDCQLVNQGSILTDAETLLNDFMAMGMIFFMNVFVPLGDGKMSSAELIIGTFILISGQTITIETNNVFNDNLTTRNEFSFMRIFISETDETSKQALNIHVALESQ